MTLLRRFTAFFSLATLVLLPAWNELLPGSVARYFGQLQRLGLATGAAALNTLLIAAALMVLWPRLRGPGTMVKALRIAMGLLLLFVTAMGLRAIVGQQVYALNGDVVRRALPAFVLRSAAGLLLLGGVLVFWVWEERVYRIGRQGLLLLSPLFFLLAFRVLANQDALPTGNPTPRESSGMGSARAVLIVFDEMDYGWTFTHRPPGLALPEVDRLAQESTFFTEAFPPGSETHRSIPALLTGQPVATAKAAQGGEFLLQSATGQWKRWSDSEDLPLEADRQGLASYLLEFYHAYGPAYRQGRPRLGMDRFPQGRWHAAQRWHRSLGAAMGHQWACIAETLPGGEGVSEEPDDLRIRVELYGAMERAALRAIQSRRYGLLILHWPVPHAPTLWDLQKGTFLASPRPQSSNLDNLALVDRTLGHLREALEASGQWEDSLVIVTSDHWQRRDFGQALPTRPPGEFRKVPLLVKWPGQKKGDRVGGAVSNLLAHDLVARALRERVQAPTPEELARHRTQWEGIYNPWIR